MPEQRPKEQGGLKRRVAAVAAGAVLALTMSGELKAASAENTAKRDPLLTLSDKRMLKVTQGIKKLIKEGDHSAYKAEDKYNGHAVKVLGLSQPYTDADGQKRYIQLVCMEFDGSDKPSTVAIIDGTSQKKYAPAETYDRLLDLTIKKPEDYAVTEYSAVPINGLVLETYERAGPLSTLAQNGANGIAVPPETVQKAFNTFTNLAVGIVDKAVENHPKASKTDPLTA